MVTLSCIMDESLPLVTVDTDSQGTSHPVFQLSESALAFLETIPAPISVVTVAGQYRTGKSYLLNRVLLNRKQGFGIGSTVNPCTKGLWLWGNTLKAVTEDDEPCQVVVIDTEGLGALDEDPDHDTRVFCLAILLASCFIYNSTTAIDEDALEQLSLVVNLTKHVHVKAQQSEEVEESDYAAYFPAFTWVVRDFSLQLINERGDKISSKDYLERALAEQRGFSEATEEKNRLRRLLRGFFPERDCICMVRPLNSEEQLQHLEALELTELRPEFQTQVFRLREKILTKVKPKKLNGKCLSGAMLAGLLRAYIAALNAGAVPAIETAWTYICKNECAKATEEAMRVYAGQTSEVEGARSQEELRNWHKKAKANALSTFTTMAVGMEAEVGKATVLAEISKKYAAFKAKNEEMAHEQAEKSLQSLYSRIEDRLNSGDFPSFPTFQKEMTAFQTYFLEKGPQDPLRRLQLAEFSLEKVSKAAHDYVQSLANDLQVTKQLSEERISTLEQELAEVKAEFSLYKASAQAKIATLESEKAELAAVKATLESQLHLTREENERVEREYREAEKRQKAEFAVQLRTSSLKIEALEEALKVAEERGQEQDSAQLQASALLQQRLAFLELSLADSSARERDYLSELSQSKKQHSSTVQDLQGKHEDALKRVQREITSESDRAAELEAEVRDLTAKVETLQTQKKEIESSLEAKITIFTAKTAEIQKNAETQISDFRQRNENLASESTEIQNRLQALLDESRRKQKSAEDTFSSESSKWLRENALITQEADFLKEQLAETERQLKEAQQHHESVVSALKSASASITQGDIDQQIKQIREDFTAKMTLQQDKSDEERDRLLKETADLAEQLEAINLKSKTDIIDWSAKEKALNDRIDSVSRENRQLQSQLLEAASVPGYEQIIDRLEAKVEELETDIEDNRRKTSSEITALNQRAAESLQQLTSAYDAEKQRLTQRITEEKEKAERRLEGLVEEWEEREREEAGLAEQRIADLETQLQACMTSWEAEHSASASRTALESQKLESLEKQLKETRETLGAVQSSHGTTMEQQLLSFQRERASLQVKIERLAADLASKDKDLMTASYTNEQFVAQISLKEREIEDIRTESGSEKAILQERLEEMKGKLRQATEDFARKKSECGKELALTRQELEFQTKRIAELAKVKEETEHRLQETVTSLKEERTRENTDLTERLALEKGTLERKLGQKRKELKETEENYLRQVTALEKERAVANERVGALEARIADMEIRHSQELSQQRFDLHSSKSHPSSSLLHPELEQIQSRLSEAEKALTDKVSAYDRDKTLWENKFNFLMGQRDSARTELANAQRRFEQNLEEVRKLAISDKEKGSSGHRLVEAEAKYAAQVREIQENLGAKIQEANDKGRNLERELRLLREELELERREKANASSSQSTRLQELMDSESLLKSQLQSQTSAWEKRLSDEKTAHEADKIALKAKFAALEERASASEQLLSQLTLDTERERARAAMDRDHLLALKTDLQDKVVQVQKRNEALLKEVEKLRTAKARSPISGRKEASRLPLMSQTFQELMQSKGESKSTPKLKGGKQGLRDRGGSQSPFQKEDSGESPR